VKMLQTGKFAGKGKTTLFFEKQAESNEDIAWMVLLSERLLRHIRYLRQLASH